MDGDDDVVAVTSQGFVDGIVDDFENHVMQAGTVLGITDVHARSFADGFQTFKDLDAAGTVILGRGGKSVGRADRNFTWHC